MRNHEHYIDRTAGEAIQRADRIRRKQRKLWGDRLAYQIGEVMDLRLFIN